jgi:alpha-L-arabinofuranosidase
MGTIKLSGFSAHSASGKLLAAGSIYVGNDDAQPEAVVSQELKLAVSGSAFSYTFPKASVTEIELR